MMVGVRSTEPGWTDNVIRYDGLASRAELVDSAGTTRYTWDGIRVLKTEDDEGVLRQRQVHGYSPIASVGDMALIESAAGDPYVPEADQVGTIWGLLDSAASKANAYSYDAFGVGRSASETLANPYRFAGKPLDADPDLYHFIARQYGPSLGTFASSDSIMDKAFPPYRIGGKCPVAGVDPFGLIPLGTRIAERYSFRTATGPFLWWYNWLFDKARIVDENQEMLTAAVVGDQISRYYDWRLGQLYLSGRLSNEWKRFEFTEDNAVPIAGSSVRGGKAFSWGWHQGNPLSPFYEAGWWLNNSCHVSAAGSFEARCTGTRLEIRNRDVEWVWYDEIDAQSVVQLWKAKENIATILLEGYVDWIGDKLGDAEFDIEISCHDDRTEVAECARPETWLEQMYRYVADYVTEQLGPWFGP